MGRSNHIVLEDLIVNDAGEYGVYLEESSDCTLENVWVSNAGDNDDGSGIKLKNSNNNVISNSISCDNNNVEGRGDFSCDGNGNSGSDNRFGSASDCGVEYSPCSCRDDCEVLYTFVLRDLDGNNLPYVSEGDIKTFQINQGEEFVIDVYVKDIIRGGIYAGYVDLNYGSNDLVDYILGSLEISSNFGSVVEGIINEPSMLVDEAGGVSTSTNTLGNGMKWLFRVKAVAVQRGIENFELNPADDFPSHYTLVYGLDSGVDVRNIEYVNARLEII